MLVHPCDLLPRSKPICLCTAYRPPINSKAKRRQQRLHSVRHSGAACVGLLVWASRQCHSSVLTDNSSDLWVNRAGCAHRRDARVAARPAASPRRGTHVLAVIDSCATVIDSTPVPVPAAPIRVPVVRGTECHAGCCCSSLCGCTAYSATESADCQRGHMGRLCTNKQAVYAHSHCAHIQP